MNEKRIDGIKRGGKMEMKKKKESGTWGRGWKKEGQKKKLWLAAAAFGCLAFLAGWMTVKTMREQKIGVIEAARMERENTYVNQSCRK